MNDATGAGQRGDEIAVRAARVVLAAGWGERSTDVPLRPVRRLSLSGRPEPSPARSVRPVFPVRIGVDGALAVPAHTEEGLETRRFLHQRVGGPVRALEVGSDAEDLTGWRVVDFSPDAGGGIHLLELLERAGGAWLNRLRHVNAGGVTTWSRQGAVDFQHTDPHHLVGVYTSLHQMSDGRLWVVPRATTAGLVAVEPADGRTLAVARLDADISNLVVSPADQAIYARMVQRGGERVLVLATTDLRTGRTTFGEPASVPLLDLAGTDSRGRVYARTPDGVAALDPAGRVLWRPRPCGVVAVAAHLIVAYATDPDRLTLVEYDADGVPRRTWPVPLGFTREEGTVRLVGVRDALGFVFHVTADLHRPGRLVTTAADGHPLVEDDDPAAVSRDLAAVESRIDLTQAAVTPDGAVLLPFSDPGGYRILRLEPEAE